MDTIPADLSNLIIKHLPITYSILLGYNDGQDHEFYLGVACIHKKEKMAIRNNNYGWLLWCFVKHIEEPVNRISSRTYDEHLSLWNHIIEKTQYRYKIIDVNFSYNWHRYLKELSESQNQDLFCKHMNMSSRSNELLLNFEDEDFIISKLVAGPITLGHIIELAITKRRYKVLEYLLPFYVGVLKIQVLIVDHKNQYIPSDNITNISQCLILAFMVRNFAAADFLLRKYYQDFESIMNNIVMYFSRFPDFRDFCSKYAAPNEVIDINGQKFVDTISMYVRIDNYISKGSDCSNMIRYILLLVIEYHTRNSHIDILKNILLAYLEYLGPSALSMLILDYKEYYTRTTPSIINHIHKIISGQVPYLRQVAKRMSIKGSYKMNKQELIRELIVNGY